MGYLFSWYTTYTYSLLIIIGSLPLRFSPQLLFPFQDKLVHALAYLLLAFLAVNTSLRKKINNPKICSFLYAFSLGLFIEIVQYFLPQRSFEFQDILANLLGSLVGILLVVSHPVKAKPQPQKRANY